MNIRLQQLNVTIGDLTGNASLILETLTQAERDNIDLLILPEMTLTAYPPMDLLERRTFLKQVYKHTDDIIDKTGSTAVIFGAPTENRNGKGRPIFNSAVFAYKGKKIAEIHKTLLPTYDVFDEYRYFEPNQRFDPVTFKGVMLGITVCEDIWYNENEKQYHTYEVQPADELKKNGAELIINISASPFTRHKPEHREQMLSQNARSFGLPILYSNQTGANTEIIFDGNSTAINEEGIIVARAGMFDDDFIDLKYNSDGLISSTPDPITPFMGEEERLFKAAVSGLRDYLNKTNISDKVLLGLSGGIDSAICAVIAAEALGPKSVIGITMPSKFSSKGSISDSEKLAANLGIELKEIPIKNIYETFLETLEPCFRGTEFGVAEENLQSRSRGVLLMALSNKFGHMLVTTGNKSEMAVGYNTLYGDLAGGLAIISDIYKTEVYDICRWLNESYYEKEIIPNSIIEKPPSAELKPDQEDTDSLPPYEVLDAILKWYIEEQLNYQDIISKGFDADTVRNVLRLVDINEYKRFQAPPGLKVSQKAFGSGRRLPIVQRWTDHDIS